MKLLPQALPTIPRRKMDLVTVNQHDYVKRTPQRKAKSFKPDEQAHQPTAPLQSFTSYRDDFPLRQPDPNPSAPTLMRTTISQPPSLPHLYGYTTTNKEMLRRWCGHSHKPSPYGEPIIQPFFQGNFHGISVYGKDYDLNALRKDQSRSRRQSTCYKPSAQAKRKKGNCNMDTNKRLGNKTLYIVKV